MHDSIRTLCYWPFVRLTATRVD